MLFEMLPHLRLMIQCIRHIPRFNTANLKLKPHVIQSSSKIDWSGVFEKINFSEQNWTETTSNIVFLGDFSCSILLWINLEFLFLFSIIGTNESERPFQAKLKIHFFIFVTQDYDIRSIQLFQAIEIFWQNWNWCCL